MPTKDSIITPAGRESDYENLHFSHAMRAGGLVFVSGQTGEEADGAMPNDDAAQWRNAFRALGAVLTAAGGDFSDLVNIVTHHVGPVQATIADFARVKDEFVGEPYPTWTVIGVTELAIPGARIEISAVAEIA